MTMHGKAWSILRKQLCQTFQRKFTLKQRKLFKITPVLLYGGITLIVPLFHIVLLIFTYIYYANLAPLFFGGGMPPL